MGELLAYSIKSAVILSVLFSVYMLTLSRIKGAALRRTALLTVCLISLLLPLLILNPVKPINNIDASGGELIPSTTSLTLPLPEGSPVVLRIITIIAIVGMIILLTHTLFGIASILWLRVKGETVAYGGVKLTIVKHKPISPFCFGGRIYVSEEEYATISAMVIAHETSHIRHLHFIDLILARTVLTLQWWNPLSWLMLKELHEVHEYQADSDVLNDGFNPTDYQYLLLTRASGKSILSFGNSLGQSKLQHRLKMINREESGLGRKLAGLLILPSGLISIMIISTPLFASLISLANNVNFSASSADAATTLPQAKELYVDNLSKNEQPDFMVNGQIVHYEDLSPLDPSLIESITVRKDTPEHPNGLIIISLKPEATYNPPIKKVDPILDHPTESWENIKVIGTTTVKKQPQKK